MSTPLSHEETNEPSRQNSRQNGAADIYRTSYNVSLTYFTTGYMYTTVSYPIGFFILVLITTRPYLNYFINYVLSTYSMSMLFPIHK